MTLEHVFDTLTEVPTFPKVVQKALTVLDDPQATLADLVEVLRYDQGLTANILRLTNSAHFGLPQQVTNLETAVKLLGEQQVRQVLIASAGFPYLPVPLGGYGLSAPELWAHSTGTAVTAETLGSRFRYPDPPLLFTAALLHDIGKIVFDLHIGMRPSEIHVLAEQEQMMFMEAEWRILGADHAIIGYNLLHQWQFPPELTRAVRNHHDPNLYIQEDLSAILAFSNILAVLLGMGVGPDSFRYRIHPIHPGLVDRLNLSQETVQQCMAEALHAFSRASDLITLEQEG